MNVYLYIINIFTILDWFERYYFFKFLQFYSINCLIIIINNVIMLTINDKTDLYIYVECKKYLKLYFDTLGSTLTLLTNGVTTEYRKAGPV